MGPSPPPLTWSASATIPAHWGQESEVPPMSYQPVLHGPLLPQISPLPPSGGSET
jgi:hypothetical protein